MDQKMEQKNMPYRIYKQRYADCKTLDDYDAIKKTITVIIPAKFVTRGWDKSVWEKDGAIYRNIADLEAFRASKTYLIDGLTIRKVREYGSGISKSYQAEWGGDKIKEFFDRDEAFNFLLTL